MKKVSIEIPNNKELVKDGDVYRLVDKRTVMERIKTLGDAVHELGEQHPLVVEYKQVKNIGSMSADVLAYMKLRIIVAALNEGWTPKFTTDEYRYYPYFVLYTQDEIDRMDEDDKSRLVVFGGSSSGGSLCGLVATSSRYAWTNSDSYAGSRLAFKTRDLALYAGKQFKKIYADFMLLKKEQ
jgi:hypothetical protein